MQQVNNIPEYPEKATAPQQEMVQAQQFTQPQQFAQPQHNCAPVVGVVAPGYSRPYPAYFTPQGAAAAIPVTLWSTGACSFMDDVDSAVESFFCGRCQMSRQYNQITYSSNKIEPWTFLGSLFVDVLLGAPLTAVAFAWYIRNRVRARYQIAGDDFNDCLMATFLPCCSIAQVYREMSVRGEWPSGACINQAYAVLPPPTMAMQDNSVSA